MPDGHQAGADTVKARLRDAVDLGVRELTVYSFSTGELERARREEVAALMGMFAERIDARRPSCTRRACGCASSGAARASPRAAEKMEWAEATTAGNDRITLFVAFNYGGRAEIVDAAARYEGGGEEEFAQAALRAGDARPRPRDPHERRAAALELPAVAVRVLGARLLRRAVARLPREDLRGRRSRVRGARAALRRALMATVSDTTAPGRLSAIPSRSASPRFIVAYGGWIFAIGAIAAGADVPARAVPHVPSA